MKKRPEIAETRFLEITRTFSDFLHFTTAFKRQEGKHFFQIFNFVPIFQFVYLPIKPFDDSKPEAITLLLVEPIGLKQFTDVLITHPTSQNDLLLRVDKIGKTIIRIANINITAKNDLKILFLQTIQYESHHRSRIMKKIIGILQIQIKSQDTFTLLLGINFSLLSFILISMSNAKR